MDTPTASAATRADKDDEVVVAVPHSAGAAAAELSSDQAGANITVRVSRQIRTGIVPAVGVIVK
jgi:hypothetical protein